MVVFGVVADYCKVLANVFASSSLPARPIHLRHFCVSELDNALTLNLCVQICHCRSLSWVRIMCVISQPEVRGFGQIYI